MKKLLLMICAMAASIAFGAATTNEGGEYTYPSWQTDNRTTGQTGDQIWNVASLLSLDRFWPGQTDVVPYWQIYRGASITTTADSLDRIMKGNVVFENDIVWAGKENYIGLTGPTKLVLRNGGSLTVSGDDLSIGQKHDKDYANTHGALFMEEPSALTTVGKNAVVGNTRPGAIWMDGGKLSITNGVLKTSGYSGQDGYIRVNGGENKLLNDLIARDNIIIVAPQATCDDGGDREWINSNVHKWAQGSRAALPEKPTLAMSAAMALLGKSVGRKKDIGELAYQRKVDHARAHAEHVGIIVLARHFC